MKNSTKSALLMALLFASACKRENTPKPGDDKLSTPITSNSFASNAGSAIFTRFIAVGDSQTAGYANDGLYNTGMINSLPQIIATQLAAAGLASFNQPLFSNAQKNGTGFLKITGVAPDGSPILSRETSQTGIRGSINIPGAGNVPLLTKYVGLNDNYGVAGLKVSDISNPLIANANSYFERLEVANSPAINHQYLDLITSSPFTFFALNLGSNDVFGYALAGGVNVAMLTDQAVFSNTYTLLVDRLTSTGAKGVVTTIPDIRGIAYFNTITVDALNAKVKALNPLYKIYVNARVSSTPGITTYSIRPAISIDLLPLTFDVTKIGVPVSTDHGMQPYGLSPYAPIEDKWVYDSRESQIGYNYTTAYNSAIKTIATSHSIALFDAFVFFNRAKPSTVSQGFTFTPAYITGGIFSLDGAHPTPRANAFLANQYINVINVKYGSKILSANLANYSAN